MKIRISLDLEGEVAEAFLKELSERVKSGGVPSRADLARTLTAEALVARKHKINVPETEWGGDRTSGSSAVGADDPAGQLAGVGAS
jgi:hypothetical protein